MLLKRALQIILITLLTFTWSCKKNNAFPVEDIICGLDYSTHPKHAAYQAVLDNFSKKGITGLTVIISTPEYGYWSGSSGFSNLEEKQQMNPCHLHHTASLAKSFTAIVTLQLIEEGKLGFDDLIAQYLSEEIQSYIPNIEKMTVKNLLQQTSGIPDVFDLAFFETIMNDPEETYTTTDFFAMIEGRPAAFEPGEKHQYADLNFNLLALIIDRIEGDHIKSFADRIFTPLGLSDIYYHNKNYPQPDGLAASYWDQYNNGQIENVSEFQIRITDYIEASDGIISSPKDMVRFYDAVFNGELVGPEMLALIKTDWVFETEENRMNTAYSQGFMGIDAEDGRWIGHTGSQVGASCYVYHNLETATTVGVFTNTGVHFFTEKKALIYYELWNDLRVVSQ
jgi:D-alanyl-D-alanine carboxypeptidase